MFVEKSGYRATQAAIWIAALSCLILMSLVRQVDGACEVRCVGLACAKNFAGKFLLIDNGKICNWWYVASAGCAAADCNCTNSTVKLTFREASGTTVCEPIQTNTGEAKSCSDPIGKSLETICCEGCTPKS